MKTNYHMKSILYHFYICFAVLLYASSNQFWAQCKGVKTPSVTLTVLDRPCGPTRTGSLALDIKGGLAPFTLTWTVDNIQDSTLPQIANTNKLTLEDLKGAYKPGYEVRVKDACGNEISSTPLQLILTVPILFVNAPQVLQLVSNKDEPNGKLRVQVRGGYPPISLVATDAKGKSFVQQIPTGPPEKGIYKYELNNLPAENYKIELKSGSKKCTQVWKETIEIKAQEK